MREELLQYAWANLLLRTLTFRTRDGEEVEVLSPGVWNRQGEGPDFQEAVIRWRSMKWYGAIEFHMESDDWYRHNHHLDKAYNQVILHVVHKSSGQVIRREDGTVVPEIELSPYLIKWPMYRAEGKQGGKLACSNLLRQVPEKIRAQAYSMGAEKRILRRLSELRLRLKELQFDWNQLYWEQMWYYSGVPYHKKAFLKAARALPYSIVIQYRDNPLALLSLFLGYFDLLKEQQSIVPVSHLIMKQLWEHLKRKHQIPSPFSDHLFPRKQSSPVNSFLFRIMETLAFFIHYPNFDETFFRKENIDQTQLIQTLEEMKEWIPVNRKWKQNGFDGLFARWKINVWLPLLLLKYQETGNPNLVGILSEYQNLPPETNHVTTTYSEQFLEPRNAWESQGILELERYFCSMQNCLSCPVGKFLLKRSSVPA
jgi:hypothetical protein